MFNCQSCQNHAQELREQRMFFEGLIKELTDKLMSRDLADYKNAQQPPKDTSEIIKEEESPYIDPEDVPENELGDALKNG